MLRKLIPREPKQETAELDDAEAVLLPVGLFPSNFGGRGPLSASVRYVRITPENPLSLPWVDTLLDG